MLMCHSVQAFTFGVDFIQSLSGQRSVVDLKPLLRDHTQDQQLSHSSKLLKLAGKMAFKLVEFLQLTYSTYRGL